MAYVDGDSLLVRIRIAFGASIAADPATWTWTDVTDYWHTPDDVTITWGRSSGAEQAETSRLSLTLKNSDGRFTAYDPRSPYWPNVRKWTPISYDIDLGDGNGWRNRFSGFVRRWPLTWPGKSAVMALARLEAVGVLGRLGRGSPPERSAMRRTVAGSGALAYWPIEDGAAAGQAASAYAGHEPLTITGTVTFAPIESWTASEGYTVNYGTEALADISAGGVLTATVPGAVTTATATAWTVAVAADVTVGSPLSADLVLAEVETPAGTFVRWRLIIIKATGRTQLIAYDSTGTATTVIDYATVLVSMIPHNVAVWQSGGTIQAGYVYDSVSGYRATGSIAGTLAGVTRVTVNATVTTATVPVLVGHLAVWAGRDLDAVDYRDGPMMASLFGHAWSGIGTPDAAATGEAATVRLARLVAEDGITLDMPAVDPDDEVMMGWQQPGTAIGLYQDCEAADVGLLYESGFGLGYLPRASRYSAPVALTIDADAEQLGTPFDPVDDDQQLRNRWTVERVDGSSAVAADADSIDAQGEIEASVRLNLAVDGPLPDHASWRLHLTTVQEPRYPAVSINVAASRELAGAWCDCLPGSRVQVVNPPPQTVPGVVDQVIVGATEVFRGRRRWRATLNVQPASVWDVAVADGTDQRVAADGSTLAASITSSAMTLSLASTTEGGIWTTSPAEFPLSIRVGGERMTVSAISGGSSPQTVTVSARGVNGVQRAWPAGTEVDVWFPAIASL